MDVIGEELAKNLTVKVSGANIVHSSTKGDWVDLQSEERYELSSGSFVEINLGGGLKIPAGYEILVTSKVGTPSTYGVIVCNALGVFKSGETLRLPVYTFRETIIPKGSVVAQCRLIGVQEYTKFK